MGGASKLRLLLSTLYPLLYLRPAALRLARHSRLSLSTAASSPHSRLPSSDSRHRPGFSVRSAEQVHTQSVVREASGDPPGSLPNSTPSHPWPEWSKLVDHLMSGGYSGRRISPAAGVDDDSFAVYVDLPAEFVEATGACLSFARDRPEALRLLSKKDIEVVVENGSPFLFKNGDNSARRMRAFLSGCENYALESERAQTVDIMLYLLSYACNPLITSDKHSIKATERIEASTRNLLNELVNVSGTVCESKFTDSAPRQEQFSRHPGQNIEMKRGDWFCPKCSFMNFARNIRCLKCDEERPKRQLTGGEWECPQCDFFNYGRNMSCLRCDCKRPENSGAPEITYGYGRNQSFEQIYNGSNTDKPAIEQRLAANDEKAERWFSKVPQLDDASGLIRAAADEDFPEIMPLRKGENRFVVSTRKTPLERRLANAKHRSNLGIDGLPEGNVSQSGGLSGTESDRATELAISQSLDRILGRSSSISETNHQSADGEVNAGVGNIFNSYEHMQNIANQRRNPDYIPSVPLSADMFSKSKKLDGNIQQSTDTEDSPSVKASHLDDSASRISQSPTESKIANESSDASERWSKKVSEFDSVTDLANAISDEDFPEIMPMRRGENRFVVSKKKDHSLTSPEYNSRLASEQANISNFVPFVPFPPDYFAKKDKQPEAAPTTVRPTETYTSPDQVQGVTYKVAETNPVASNMEMARSTSQSQENLTDSNQDMGFSEKSKMVAFYGAPATNPSQPPGNSWNSNSESQNNGALQKGNTFDGPSASGLPPQPAENLRNAKESWKYTGTSLEGSAVKEPNPLDMSEEAKAERWFRRVAQIKNISELRQIPDEDFPEIMPMRKGVNRFVVSKRKTPLERRLTSQYRGNLPIVGSEPENDN